MTHEQALNTLLLDLDQAIEAGSEDAARALCTVPGWAGSEHGVQGFFAQAVRKGLRLESLGEHHVFGPRALVEADLRRREGGSSLGVLRLLVSRLGRTWQLEGITKTPGLAQAFLEGEAPQALQLEQLPHSPELQRWGNALLERVREGDQAVLDAWPEYSPPELHAFLPHLYALVEQQAITLEVSDARLHAPSGRGVVCVVGRSPEGVEERWYLVVEVGDSPGSFNPLRVNALPTLSGLLQE